MTATHAISRRWARALSLTGALVALAGAAAPAAAEPQYNNGAFVSLYATSPVTGLRHAATSWFAGYLGETTDPAFPRTGDVFYIRGIVANTSGSLTDAPIMSFVFDERFDPDVDYAISADTPVLCLFYPDINEAGQPDPEHCRQTPDPGFVAGGSFFGGGRVLQPGEGFEVRVPVRVSVPKNGLADGAAARFGVHVLSSHGEGLAVQSVVVTAGAGGAPPPPSAPPAPAPVPAGPDVVAPRATGVAVAVSPRAATSGRRRADLRLRLSEPARVTVRLQRRMRSGAPFRALGSPSSRRLAAGPAVIGLGRLAAGSYRVLLEVRDASGNQTVVRKSFVVRP